jgi:hypothetical protein
MKLGIGGRTSFSRWRVRPGLLNSFTPRLLAGSSEHIHTELFGEQRQATEL